jgi:nucleotide-binding universal stress UspA family protein
MPYARETVRFGSAIASVTQASVTLLHVTSKDRQQLPGERILEQAREMLPEHLPVEAFIRQGKPAAQILSELEKKDYDMVIIGANQKMGLRQFLLGSVAVKIVRYAPTSVLVVRGARTGLKRLLICTGGIEVAMPVIVMGARLAGAAGAQTTLLHVNNAVPSMYTGLGGMEETLADLLQTDTPLAHHLRQGAQILAQHQVEADLQLRWGTPASEILQEACEGDYDLVIIGASGAAGRLREWLLGNVSREIVETCKRPILVVRESAEALTSD